MCRNLTSTRKSVVNHHFKRMTTLIARFMRPTWGPPGADRTQKGPMLAPWTFLFGYSPIRTEIKLNIKYFDVIRWSYSAMSSQLTFATHRVDMPKPPRNSVMLMRGNFFASCYGIQSTGIKPKVSCGVGIRAAKSACTVTTKNIPTKRNSCQFIYIYICIYISRDYCFVN